MEGGGLVCCSTEQMFQISKIYLTHHVISKVITTLPSLNSKETQRVFIFAMHFISSLARSQTFLECQVWGMALHYAMPSRGTNMKHPGAWCGVTHGPFSVVFNLLKDSYIFISQAEKGALSTSSRTGN